MDKTVEIRGLGGTYWLSAHLPLLSVRPCLLSVYLSIRVAGIDKEQTWAQDTFKISSSTPSSYFYIQDKKQVLCSLKNTSPSKNL